MVMVVASVISSHLKSRNEKGSVFIIFELVIVDSPTFVDFHMRLHLLRVDFTLHNNHVLILQRRAVVFIILVDSHTLLRKRTNQHKHFNFQQTTNNKQDTRYYSGSIAAMSSVMRSGAMSSKYGEKKN